MTRSNRLLNRTVLVITGLLALAVGAVVALPAIPDGWLAAVGVDRSAVRLRELAGSELWLGAGGAALVVVLALVWMLTRGRGRTSTPVVVDGTELDIRVVEQLLRQATDGAPDLVGVHATAYRVRRTPVVRVRLDVRRGADLPRLLETFDRAVTRLDRTLGVQLPLLAHITTGVRSALSREHRAA